MTIAARSYLSAAAFLLALAAPARAETMVVPKGIRVVNSWIVSKSDQKLTEAPRNVAGNTSVGYVDNPEDFDKLWRAWRTEPTPKLDFSKHVVLVLTHAEHGNVQFLLDCDANRNLTVKVATKGRSLGGMTYVLAIVPREELRAIGTTQIPPAK